MSVSVDKELCVSSGRCVADVPEVFAFDAEELAEVRSDAGDVDAARLRAAARNCPGQAIEVDAPPAAG
ncbi:ferredoxin [Acidimicrobiaceae bacterium USS-CC1]|uniref:Ferredoxin n=1 Tax=Acidiferrimicrobium australe TaxID=2664430 RepID=A0ABW9QPW7_9ACTN|nr:ferredoxin [Acidiferrimicrobium australe]